MTPAEAAEAIVRHAVRLPVESLSLTQLAGTVLREALSASRDQPPFDRVTMDGIAFASTADRRTFRIAGIQAAGQRAMVLASQDACFEVMTGAPVPTGCDCVVPVERLSVHEGVATLADDVVPASGMNIHKRGLDCRAGTILLEEGVRLAAPEVAVIASTGLSQALATRRPRIMVVSTGDELVEPGEPIQPWQIYRSNVYGVLAALRLHGYEDVAHDHMPDDREALRERLRQHLIEHDVLILSGGVSMGKFDYVPQVLVELGIRMIFHKVAQRPGRPMWFGVGGGKTVYALPGNPVSTQICLARYVLPGLAIAAGAPQNDPEPAVLAEGFDVKPALAFFLPVEILGDPSGQRVVKPHPTQGSGDFTSLIGTAGFVELPPGPCSIAAGTVVPFYRW